MTMYVYIYIYIVKEKTDKTSSWQLLELFNKSIYNALLEGQYSIYYTLKGMWDLYPESEQIPYLNFIDILLCMYSHTSSYIEIQCLKASIIVVV